MPNPRKLQSPQAVGLLSAVTVRLPGPPQEPGWVHSPSPQDKQLHASLQAASLTQAGTQSPRT